MDKKQENKKVFLEIVHQLRQLIKHEGIQPGEKLPSERVLSERLNVGRSSVREALRSLELLGLIETRHGGGTFLNAVHSNQLVELLASFILQENQAIEDVHIVRRMHEKEAIRVICSEQSLRSLPVWESLFMKLELENGIVRDLLLRELMIASGNRLALKIWLQLAAYSATPLKKISTEDEKPMLRMLIKSLQLGYEKEALNAYENWIYYLRNSSS
ncbi:MAG TPA: GntR family transcriptional regulator [Ureibacillus sp.]|nr:GntR family transcriptional regulator [Ureibacillus sp.]